MSDDDKLARLPSPDDAGQLTTVEVEKAREYAHASNAKSTRRAYSSHWQRFVTWCAEHAADPVRCPPATVAVYLSHLAETGKKVATIEGALSALTMARMLAGAPGTRTDPAIKRTMQGIRNQLGTAPLEKAPAVASEVYQMVAVIPMDTLAGLRDRAILLVGFGGGFRRSELVGLDVEDLAFLPEGVKIHIRRSKTDQEGRGRDVGIPVAPTEETCPLHALRAWLDRAGIVDGPVFRGVDRFGRVSDKRLSGYSVAVIVKESAESIGLDAAKYAGHSLRAGFVTSAHEAGADMSSIMDQTGHKSAEMVRRYIRRADLFKGNAFSKIAK